MENWYSFVTEYDIVIKLLYNNGGKLIMYNNVGEKLKTIAQTIAGILIAISILFTLVALAADIALFVVGLFMILMSWLSGIVLYAFGHLIVTQESILKEQKAIANALRMMKSSEKTKMLMTIIL